MIAPGTRVVVTRGPLGVVHYKHAQRFADWTIPVGYVTDVSDVPCEVEGWVYLNTDQDEYVCPVGPGFFEVVAE